VPLPAALRYPAFRWLWTGSLFSWASQWIQQASLGWVVYEITGSGTVLGVVLGMRAIPMLLLAPFSGVAADRYDRRRLLQASQVLAAGVSFCFGAALAFEAVTLWMLFALTLLMGASNVLDRPARFSTAFELVPRDVAITAVALNTTGFSLMRVIGPALAGYLIAGVGAAGSFLLQGLLYGASAAMVWRVAFPARAPRAHERSIAADMAEGLRFAVVDGNTRLLLVLGGLPFLLLVPTWGTLLPIYAKDIFQAGPEGLGMLLTSVGAGGTLGGVLAARLGRAARQGTIQVVSIAVMGFSIIGLALSPSLAVALFFGVVGGAAEMLHMASNVAALQLLAPEAMRGRVSSLTMFYPGFISIGAFIAGPLAQAIGARSASVLLAVLALAAIAVLYALSPRLRGLRLR
jgi:MFS family permease